MKPAATKGQDEWNLEWLLPVGFLGVVAVLAIRFVGSGVMGLENDRSAQLVELGLALSALGVIAWGSVLTIRKKAQQHGVLRDRLLLVIGLASFLGYFNFGHLHFNNFVHVWDTYHYYIGAKYFPEVGYERMYDCAMVADAESGRAAEAKRFTITDLRTNVIVRTDEILKDPSGRCTQYFSAERWADFKADINAFRGWVGERRWQEIHKDHGYNATPVWTLAGLAVTNTGRATHAQIVTLNLLDPLYLALTALIVWWAFGLRAFALALLVLGTNFPNRFYWTGGSLLRHDWLFYLVASVALLRKERYALGGAAIAYATLLRLFPGFVVLGPVVGAVAYFRLHQKLDPRFVRFTLGGIVATVVLVGASFAFVGGPSTWQRFAQNTVKHASTPLTNHMGLRTVLSYRPDAIGQRLVDHASIDPWSDWKSTRLEKWAEAKPLAFLLLGGALLLIYLALKNSGAEPWMGAAMGAGLIPFGAELTCYYYSFLMALAVLHERRREVGVLIAGMCATTLFLEIGPLPGMSHWLDEQYVTMTVATLVAITGVWWLFTRWGDAVCLAPEPPVRLRLALAGAGAGDSSTPSREASSDRSSGSKKKKRKR